MRKFKRCITTITAIAMAASVMTTSYSHAQSSTNQNAEDMGIVSAPELQAENAIGSLLLDSIETNTAEGSNSETNCISNLEFDSETGTVSVEYSSENTCTMLVGFYNDEGTELITSVESEVDSDLNITDITVDTAVLPENYLIKAFLLGLNQQPLSEPFICDTYTKVKQGILAKTINDFEPEYVINLDNNDVNNFMVLNKNVILADSDTGENTLVSGNDQTGVYTYSNISEEISSLQPGDIFYNTQNEDIIIVKVENITVNGDTATITAADTSLEEVFEFVKIDTEVNNADDWSIDTSNLDENTTFLNSTDTGTIPNVFSNNKTGNTGSVENSHEFNYDFNDNDDDSKAKLSLEIGIGITLKLEYNYSAFDSYVSVELKTEISGSVTASGSVEVSSIGKQELSIPLGTYGVSPVTGVFLQIEPKLVARFEGEIAGKLTVKKELGVLYDTNNGARDISSPTEVELSAEISGTVFAGFDLNPNVVLVSKKIMKAGITAEVGPEIVGELTADIGTGTDTVHDCDVCCSAETCFVARLGFEIEGIGGLIDFEGTLFEPKFVKTEMYCSVTYGEYGFGKCPHIKNKVTFIVSDENDNPINNAVIEYDNNKYETDATGKVDVYISAADEGVPLCKVSADGYQSFYKGFKYEAEPREVFIELSKPPTTSVTETETGTETLTTTVTNTTTTTTPEDEDIASGTCGDNLTWVLDSNGVLTISGTGKMTNLSWFDYSDSIVSVVIGDGVEEIYNGFWLYCPNVVEIKVDEENEFYSSSDGVLFNKDKTELLAYPMSNKDEFYVIPDSVTTIGASAFLSCIGLTSITIPDSLTTIDDYAFEHCRGLKSITIPDNVTTLGICVFRGCINLASITLPDSLTTIGSAAFVGCESLTSIIIPDSVTTIADSIFYGCESLTSITLPDSVTTIGSSAFYNTSLLSITLPDSLTTIGGGAFQSCDSLTSIIIPDGVTAIYGTAFHSCVSLTSITIPDSVTNLGDMAFWGCDSLATASIPAHLADCVDAFNGNTIVTIRDSVSTEETTATAEESPILFSSNKSAAEDVTSQPETFTYTGSPNSTYIFIAVKDDDAEDLLSNENVLYIDQKKSDENGEVTFEYIVNEECRYIFGGNLGNGGFCRTSGTLDIENETCTICGAEFGDIPAVTTTSTTTTVTTTTTTVSSTTEQEDIISLGDLNSDNSVTVVDASLVLKEYAIRATEGTPQFTERQQKAADVNFDGRITVVDASIILNYYAYTATGGSLSMEEYLNVK